MSTCFERICHYAHALRQIGFWLLAVEGAMLSILFLVPLVEAMFTLPHLVQHEPISITFAVTLFYLLAIGSICETAQQIGRKKWTTVPGTLHLWLLIGGGFLFFLVLYRGTTPGWELADIALLFSITLTIVLESFANVTETLFMWWLQRKKNGDTGR